MSQTQAKITTLDAGDASHISSLLGKSASDFLKQLPGPAWLELKGKDETRRRAIVTLLHGNEPSGLKAIHRLLSEGITPATNVGILIAGVDAARHAPLFSHRFIPGERDLNRCFAPTVVDDQHLLAKNILGVLEQYAPEAVVDTHNTSSHSQPFCVAVDKRPMTRCIAALFASNLIIINQPLGTLLEYLDNSIPVVTAEFGGFIDPRADDIAYETLKAFMTEADLSTKDSSNLNLLAHSMRLETKRELTVAYGSTLIEDADLTMINTIDQLNFSVLPTGHTIGWFTASEHGHLHVVNDAGEDVFDQYFQQNDGLLTTRQEMTIFMATTDPVVANTDCLLYFNPLNQPE